MPDLTVIEGGGERRDWDREISQQHFEAFVVVLLRSLAAGDGSYRLTQDFFRFLEHAQDSKVPIGPVLDARSETCMSRPSTAMVTTATTPRRSTCCKLPFA